MLGGILINIIKDIEAHKVAYLKYRGSSFDKEGNLLWAKDDAMAYAEGLDAAILIIKGETIEIK
jgi:hypothetical protein